MHLYPTNRVIKDKISVTTNRAQRVSKGRRHALLCIQDRNPQNRTREIEGARPCVYIGRKLKNCDEGLME